MGRNLRAFWESTTSIVNRTVAAMASALSSTFAPYSHTHPANQISDSTATGRGVLTGATQTANTALRGPSSGGAAAPTWRASVKADQVSTTAYTDQANTFSSGLQTISGGISTTTVTASGAIFGGSLGTGGDLTVTGNVGIGINPGYRFHLSTNSNSAVRLAVENFSTGSSAYSEFFLKNSAGQAGFFLNGSGRTSDGGASGLSFYNDVGAFRVRTLTTYTIATGSFPGTDKVVFATAGGFGLWDNSSTSTSRQQLAITPSWVVSTDASRTARVVYSVYDTAAREAMRFEASGSAAMIGFYGSAATAKQTVTGSRGSNAALASLLTALANLGLITDSTT